MKKDLTELVIIIDKSGSMSGLESDVIGGFNSLITEQKKEEGEVNVTIIFFDTTYKVIHDRENINNIKNLEKKDYIPSGCTSLLDTVGNAINHIKEVHSKIKDECIPEHTIFSIMTDGCENSSKEYTYKQIKEMIEKQKELGWDFIFQAANIDAPTEGSKLGINVEDISSFDATDKGVEVCMCYCSNAIKRKRKTIKKLD